MDLKAFADDRDARNISSYRPDGIPTFWKLDPAETLTFVRSIWGSFEPASNSTFEAIDSQILRIALETKYRGQFGVGAQVDPAKFSEWLGPILDYQNLSEGITNQWRSFLTRTAATEDAAIFKFSKDPPTNPNSHFGVISRAALLLRLSIGSTCKLVDEAGLHFSTMEFWSHDFGKSRGIWDDDTKGEATDLWADVSPLLQDIETFQLKHGLDKQTFFRSGTELSSAIVGLASFERVVLWSVMHSN